MNSHDRLAVANDLAPEPVPGTPVVKPRALRRWPSYRPESSPAVRLSHGPRIGSASDVYMAVADIRGADREHFVCFDLDVRHRVIARRVVAIGTLTGVEAHPREVFRPAIVNGAAAIVCCHNHPSMDVTPSRQDVELTARLREVGELVGIVVLDHVIVTEGGFVSLADRGWA